MRERPSSCTAASWSGGITPARAGKTELLKRALKIVEDHPRSCGKDLFGKSPLYEIPGSPPLVRERQMACCGTDGQFRITPARAGKTAGFTVWPGMHRDHPRSCGKDDWENLPIRRNGGSPPLVRERPLGPSILPVYRGITPARAGKTSATTSSICAGGDHPRSCGKDSSSATAIASAMGSPPLVRERHGRWRESMNVARITPARAGKTHTRQP